MTTLDDRLLPVFARQHWLVGLDDVVAAAGRRRIGPRRRPIRTLVASRRQRVPARRVRRRPGSSRLLAPILAIGGGAVASHFAAAALHGIEGFGRGSPRDLHPDEGASTAEPPHRSTPAPTSTAAATRGRRRHPSDGRRPHAARHRPTRRRRSRLLRHRVESRASNGRTGLRWSRTLARHARRGRPGIRRLRRVIAANIDRDEVTDSDFELLVLALLAEAGLPTPDAPPPRARGERFVAEVDLAYPELEDRDRARRRRPPAPRRARAGPRHARTTSCSRAGSSSGSPGDGTADRPEQVVAEIRAAIAPARGGLSHSVWRLLAHSARMHHKFAGLIGPPQTVALVGGFRQRTPQVAAGGRACGELRLAQPDRAWARSAWRSSTCSRPTDMRTRPSVMPSSSALRGGVAACDRRRVGQQRLRAAERQGDPREPAALDERGRGVGAAGHLEGDDRATGAHLAPGEIVLRVAGQERVRHGLDGGVVLEERRQRERRLGLLPGAHAEGADAPDRVPRIERRGLRAHRRLPRPDRDR